MNHTQWEYDIVRLPRWLDANDLRERGGKGWELVAVCFDTRNDCIVSYWKRPKLGPEEIKLTPI